MEKPLFTRAFCCIVLLFAAGAVNAVVLPLESRLDGLAYYDPNLDITWAANASINNNDTWDLQVLWVENLILGGVSGWRLPNADVNGDGTVVFVLATTPKRAQIMKWAFSSGRKTYLSRHQIRSAASCSSSATGQVQLWLEILTALGT